MIFAVLLEILQMTRATISLDDLDGSNGYRLELAGFQTNLFIVAPLGDLNADGISDFLVADNSNSAMQDPVVAVFGRGGDFDAVEQIRSLDGVNGFRLEGFRATLGRTGILYPSAAGAGDVDGDGFDDIVAAAGGRGLGKFSVYVLPGQEGRFPSTIFVKEDTNIDLALEFPTISGSPFWASIAGIGDFNGDGLGDFVLGLPGDNDFPSAAPGGAVVVFGRRGGFDSPVDPTALDGTLGFRLIPETGRVINDGLGSSVSGIGDINGDGLDDLVVSSPGLVIETRDFNVNLGKNYVIFGSKNNFSSDLFLSDLNGINGFSIQGSDLVSVNSNSLTNVGDVNGDSVSDLVFGIRDFRSSAPLQSGVIFGRTDGFAPRYIVGSVAGDPTVKIDPEAGYLIPGAGNLVSGAGDVDGDGVNDLLVTTSSNGVHLLYGTRDGRPISVETIMLTSGEVELKPDGVSGFTINTGVNGSGIFFGGAFVTGPGDVNGDGYDDIVVATPDSEVRPGAVHVIFGAPRNPPTQTVTVTLSGQAFQGDPRFDLFVDGEAVATGVAVPSSAAPPAPGTRPPAQTFTFEVDAAIDIERVGVAFVNDRFGGAPDRDRNLFVESVSFGGETYGLGPDALYFGPGGTNVAVARGVEATGELRRNGLLEFGEHREITVHAAGQAFRGDPRFDLLVNGAVVARGVAVDSANRAQTRAQLEDAAEAFVFRVSRGVEIDQVSIRFANDRFGGDRNRDRNLFIDRIEIDDGDGPVRVLEAEVDGVYTRANGTVVGPADLLRFSGHLVFDDLAATV